MGTAWFYDDTPERAEADYMAGRAVYACMLNPEGKFIDDCVIYRLSVNHWMVVHGTGTGMEQLTSAAAAKDVAVIFDDDLHDMSLQGPVAVDFLADHVPGIRDLAYFGIMQTKMFGCPVMISRTGYTGERGYEIFCQARHAETIWDNILEKLSKEKSVSKSTGSSSKAPPLRMREQSCTRTANRWAM